MTDQLVEIGGRLAALRDIMDISAEKMATDLKLSLDEYLAYEKGTRDFSFSFLYNAAGLLGVDLIDIISGESTKLATCAIVRKGEGFSVSRIKEYDYKHLAFTFSHKKAEPFMVTVEPKANADFKLHSHDGQEFNYIVSGKMEFHHDNSVYQLSEGDSIYFDSSLPHGIKVANGEPLKFIAVVIK